MHWVETDRLCLRRFTPDDAGALHRAIYSDPEVMLFLPGRVPRSLQRTADVIDFFADHWQHHHFGAWAVEHREEGALIGQAGLQYLPNSPQVEVFYAIGSAYWGQGFATEAAHAALRYGFEELKLERVIGLVALENAASERVLRKLGMGFDKVARHYDMKLKRYTITARRFKPGDGLYTLHQK